MAPRIDSLSQHTLEIGQQEKIFVNGSGFVDLQGVAIGDVWATDFRVDGDSIITVTLPQLAVGSYAVVAWTNGNESSPSGDANQQLEIVAAAADHTPMRIDSITPEEITLPLDGQPFWLQGAGLTRVTTAMTGHHAITFEGYDETRLQIWLPAHLEAQVGHEIELEVLGHGESATFKVPVRGRPSGAATHPSVFSIEPTSLTAEGGHLTVNGANFAPDAGLYVGEHACTDVDVVSEGILRCTVPALTGHEGTSLMVVATGNGAMSVATDVHLAVAAS